MEILVVTPLQEEIEAVLEYLSQNSETARLFDIATYAAFALMAREPSTGERIFANTDIQRLTLRNRAAMIDVMDACPGPAQATRQAIIEARTPEKWKALGKPKDEAPQIAEAPASTNSSPKKAKKPNVKNSK